MQQDSRPLGGADIKKFKAHFKNSMQSLPDVCETEHIILVEGKDLSEVTQPQIQVSQAAEESI